MQFSLNSSLVISLVSSDIFLNFLRFPLVFLAFAENGLAPLRCARIPEGIQICMSFNRFFIDFGALGPPFWVVFGGPGPPF